MSYQGLIAYLNRFISNYQINKLLQRATNVAMTYASYWKIVLQIPVRETKALSFQDGKIENLPVSFNKYSKIGKL